jgi:hypothetical protein
VLRRDSAQSAKKSGNTFHLAGKLGPRCERWLPAILIRTASASLE